MTQPQSGADLIAAERRRQVTEEGYTPEHDIEHGNDALAWAAVCYAAPETVYRVENRQVGNQNEHLVRYWEPWPAHWKRGTYDNGFRFEDDRVRNLVKAGALIAAEIDRLTAREQRPTRPTTAPPPPGAPDGKGWDDLDAATTGQP